MSNNIGMTLLETHTDLQVQSPVVLSCIDVVEERHQGAITHTQVVIKLTELLPLQSTYGALMRYIEQLADIESTRAIARQCGNKLNPTTDQPTAQGQGDSPDVPGDIITPGNTTAGRSSQKQSADKQTSDDDIPCYKRPTDEALYPW